MTNMRYVLPLAEIGGTPPPIAQMADIGFKVVLLERLNQKWKQKHFSNPYKKSFNRGGVRFLPKRATFNSISIIVK